MATMELDEPAWPTSNINPLQTPNVKTSYDKEYSQCIPSKRKVSDNPESQAPTIRGSVLDRLKRRTVGQGPGSGSSEEIEAEIEVFYFYKYFEIRLT